MTRTVSPDFLSMLPVVFVVMLIPLSWGSEELHPGCHLRPINLTIRSDRRGTCQGSQVVYSCVGHCESSTFPSRYSVLKASNFTRHFTSISRCCTISKLAKVKVQIYCQRGHPHDHIEILSAQNCRCDMCHKSHQ